MRADCVPLVSERLGAECISKLDVIVLGFRLLHVSKPCSEVLNDSCNTISISIVLVDCNKLTASSVAQFDTSEFDSLPARQTASWQ